MSDQEQTSVVNQIILLQRDCDATLIPAGTPLDLPKGTEVTITQALGGSYTVNVYGNLVRIAAKDADALGFEPIDVLADLPEDASLIDQVWAVLKTCYDPEISVNIVDLGLVYDCSLSAHDSGQQQLNITMTLTSPGCGMGPVLEEDVRQRAGALDNVAEVIVDMVFDPPWTRESMSDAARLELGLL